MRRTKQESLETRAKLLDAALDVFSEKNFSNASLTEISARAGMSKGALYWHFRNKNDLLLRLVEEICRRSEEGAKNAFGSPACTQSVRSYYMDAYLRFKEGDVKKKVYMIMMKRDEWPVDVQKSVERMIKESMGREKTMIEEAIANGQKRGLLRSDVSPTAVAVLVSSIFHGLSVMLLADMLPPEFPEYTDILFDALKRELTESDAAR